MPSLAKLTAMHQPLAVYRVYFDSNEGTEGNLYGLWLNNPRKTSPKFRAVPWRV
jgi:hypothetical protein